MPFKTVGALTVIYKGELIKPEDTYMRKHIRSDENFILMTGSLEAKRWKRFGRVETGDYFYMSESCYDAVAFKPKMDVFFLGFGFIN